MSPWHGGYSVRLPTDPVQRANLKKIAAAAELDDQQVVLAARQIVDVLGEELLK